MHCHSPAGVYVVSQVVSCPPFVLRLVLLRSLFVLGRLPPRARIPKAAKQEDQGVAFCRLGGLMESNVRVGEHMLVDMRDVSAGAGLPAISNQYRCLFHHTHAN